MNLLSRYVAEVRRHLPASLREDVGRELHGLLEDRIESEGEKHGRELSEDEIATLLARHGHPYKVAASYHRGGTALVGVSAYALYKRTMANVVAIWFTVVILLGLYHLFQQREGWAIVAVPDFWHEAADTLLFLFFAMTMLFHAAGDALDRSPAVWRWNPRRLPATEATWILIPITRTIVHAVVAVSLLGAITAGAYRVEFATGSVAIAEASVQAIPALQAVLLAALALLVVNLYQRYWTRLKLYAVGAIAVAAALVQAWAALPRRVIHLTEQSAGAGDFSQTFIAVWPDVVLKVLSVALIVVLVRKALRAWRQAATPGMPLA